MGRHEPLTSLALGRSPYDDVVEGEGEPDPREPTREYDPSGRLINGISKQMNKDIIRAHNQVMLVIGVAEQDPGSPGNSADEAARLHHEYESSLGRFLLRIGRVLVVAGIWGVHGVRQRILVYRETASFPFIALMRREMTMHTPAQFLFAGMPSFFITWTLQWYSRVSDLARDNIWFRAIISHIRFHLQIYVTMQRLDLIPGSRWLPNPSFFIPFSNSSPFAAPPALGSPSPQNLAQWVGRIAANLAPYAGYYLIGFVWDISSSLIRRKIHKSLPHPWPGSITNLRALSTPRTPRRQSFLGSPTLGDADREIRDTLWPEVDNTILEAIDEDAGEPLPAGTMRRQGTFSSRGGEDYVTDEEDGETVNPTLISFDVDTSESTEPPAGVWSAELRPTTSADTRIQPKDAPRYVVNTLTTLPSLLGSDILTSSLTHVLLTPLDILAFRSMARAYSLKLGLPTSHIFESSLTDGLVSRTLLNLFQIEVLKFLVSCEPWAIITFIAQRLHFTEEEWKEYQSRVERAAETEAIAEATETSEPS